MGRKIIWPKFDIRKFLHLFMLYISTYAYGIFNVYISREYVSESAKWLMYIGSIPFMIPMFVLMCILLYFLFEYIVVSEDEIRFYNWFIPTATLNITERLIVTVVYFRKLNGGKRFEYLIITDSPENAKNLTVNPLIFMIPKKVVRKNAHGTSVTMWYNKKYVDELVRYCGAEVIEVEIRMERDYEEIDFDKDIFKRGKK